MMLKASVWDNQSQRRLGIDWLMTKNRVVTAVETVDSPDGNGAVRVSRPTCIF